MTNALSKYAYLNAKIRARLSRFLTEYDIERLVNSGSIDEAYNVLRQTSYAPLFAKVDSSVPLPEVESLIFTNEVYHYLELMRDAHGEVREVVRAMLRHYEMENLKQVLRVWHNKKQFEKSRFLFRGKIVEDIPVDKLLKSENFEETILHLDNTPYKSALMRMRELYNQTGNLFYIEVGLDVQYYLELWSKLSKLSRADRKVAQRLIGIEIDIRNINWVVRFRYYHKLPMGEALRLLIPNGYRVSEEFVREAYLNENMRAVIEGMLDGYYLNIPAMSLAEDDLNNLQILEAILWQFLFREVTRCLSGYPFSIGILLAYLTLRKIDTQNIISVLNGKMYGIKPAAISANLVLR